MKIAAVVLNWKNPEATLNCVYELMAFFDSSDIYIVDNNSLDHSLSMFERYLNNCNVISNIENTGYTGGNNIGLKSVFLDDYDAALVLNNDVIPKFSKNFRTVLSALYTVNPKVVIGVEVYNLSGKIIYPQLPGFLFKSIFDACGIDKSMKIICGCAIFITRETFNSIGGFDESFFMYCEELEYSIRATKSGCHIVSSFEIGCVVRDDKEMRRPYVYYYQTRNLFYLIKLHSQSPGFHLFFLSFIVSLKQAIQSFKFVNLYRTINGAFDALRSLTGRNPKVHTLR